MIANPPVELTDLGQVERALAASHDGGPGAVRATTLNLVVYAPTPDDVAYTQRALERIGGSRPLRAIVAAARADGVRATRLDLVLAGRRHAAGVLGADPALTARADALPSAVLSLLVTDLPTFVWWQGPIPAELSLLSDLATHATSTIVDSNISSLEGVDTVGRLDPSVTDLAWLRLEPVARGDRIALRPAAGRRCAGRAARGRCAGAGQRGPSARRLARLAPGPSTSRSSIAIGRTSSGSPCAAPSPSS